MSLTTKDLQDLFFLLGSDASYSKSTTCCKKLYTKFRCSGKLKLKTWYIANKIAIESAADDEGILMGTRSAFRYRRSPMTINPGWIMPSVSACRSASAKLVPS